MNPFVPMLSLATRGHCVIVQGAHLGRTTEFVLAPDQARDLARQLLAQADAAEHPKRRGVPGIEVTEYMPLPAGVSA